MRSIVLLNIPRVCVYVPGTHHRSWRSGLQHNLRGDRPVLSLPCADRARLPRLGRIGGRFMGLLPVLALPAHGQQHSGGGALRALGCERIVCSCGRHRKSVRILSPAVLLHMGLAWNCYSNAFRHISAACRCCKLGHVSTMLILSKQSTYLNHLPGCCSCVRCDVGCGRYVRHGAWLEGLNDFDQGLFGVPPGDALALDPQSRILLEQVQVGSAACGSNVQGSQLVASMAVQSKCTKAYQSSGWQAWLRRRLQGRQVQRCGRRAPASACMWAACTPSFLILCLAPWCACLPAAQLYTFCQVASQMKGLVT